MSPGTVNSFAYSSETLARCSPVDGTAGDLSSPVVSAGALAMGGVPGPATLTTTTTTAPTITGV